jgi:hypothetical protein
MRGRSDRPAPLRLAAAIHRCRRTADISPSALQRKEARGLGSLQIPPESDRAMEPIPISRVSRQDLL